MTLKWTWGGRRFEWFPPFGSRHALAVSSKLARYFWEYHGFGFWSRNDRAVIAPGHRAPTVEPKEESHE